MTQRMVFMNKYKVTTIYSILHFFVDGICALAMFGWFVNQKNSYWYFFAYNFCAFALQMPFGAFLDMLIMNWSSKKKNAHVMYPYLFATIGVLFTILGAILHPILLGIGNALFHVGGGVGVIYEDHANYWNGKALGVFVAPGALGLFLGTQIAKVNGESIKIAMLVFFSILTIVLLIALIHKDPVKELVNKIEKPTTGSGTILAIGCFLVVILRSYVGMAVTFSWKSGFLLGLVCVLAVVLGKMAGGLFAAKWGIKPVMFISLLIAATSYCFSENIVCGIIAVFAFNMSMPITLYLLVCKFKELPGFAFGLLTFGLFLGYLPIYFGIPTPFDGNIVGAGGSVISLLILLLAMKFGGIADVD